MAISCGSSNTPDTQNTSQAASAVTPNDLASHRHGWPTGGTASTGGAMSTGGVTKSGGATSTGGVGTGGVTSVGGSSGTGGVVATGGTGTSGLFNNGFFLIGTFMPNMADFKVWHDRGVNTGVGENYTDPATGLTNPTSLQAWDKAAQAQGMRTIRRPMPNPSDDITNTTLLAWAQMDEPDAAGAGMKNLANEVANYQKWKAADANRPVYLNFAGPDVLTAIDGPKPSWCLDSTGGCSLATNHIDYINGALDWVSNDIYPVAGYLPDESRRYDVSLVGDPIDRIRSWTDKPVFCYIETSNQKYTTNSTRGVTRDEVRAEIWVAIVHGVRGYVFFPQVVPPDGVGATNDGTPADVAAELTIQNATVTQLAPVLQGAINPTTLGAAVPTPLQAGWRDAPGGRYFFVVNTKQATLTNAAITLTGVGTATSASVFGESRTVALTNGKLTDTFGAFAVHIYVVANSGGATSTGGAMSAGGMASTGGAVSAGGVTKSGGITSTGGVVGTGGVTKSGGATSSGGASTGGVVSAGGSHGTGGVSSGGTQSSSASIHLVGNKILDSAGNPITARGAEAAMAGVDQTADVDTISGKGANAMRMLLTLDAANGMTPAGFDSLLAEAVSRRMVVWLSLFVWDNTQNYAISNALGGGNFYSLTGPAGNACSAATPASCYLAVWSRQWLKDLANKYRGHVIIDAGQEFISTLDASTEAGRVAWASAAKTNIQFFRSQGYTNPLEIMANYQGRDLYGIVEYGSAIRAVDTVRVGSDPQTMFGWQAYWGTSDGYYPSWQGGLLLGHAGVVTGAQAIHQFAATQPFPIQIGFDNYAGDTNLDYQSEIDQAATDNMSWLWWSWNNGALQCPVSGATCQAYVTGSQNGFPGAKPLTL